MRPDTARDRARAANGTPMVVDGPAEVARLDAQIVVLGEALDEVRGAILEYQATRKGWVMPRLRRQRGEAARR